MPPAAITHLADAIRQATLQQVLSRPRRLLPPRALALGLSEADAPNWRPLAVGLGVDPAPQSGPLPPAHLDDTFRGVGASRRFDDAGFWTDERDGLLFLFGLHGFEGLAAHAAGGNRAGDAFWERVWGDWLDRFARPSAPAWHPYPLSHRVIAWTAALSRGGWPDALERRALRSLFLQTRFLRRSVEHDIGGNHVFVNAVALAIGGTCLGDQRVARQGMSLLRHEVAQQVLGDGGHCERSPSYHRQLTQLLEDAADVLERAGESVADLRDVIVRMRAWMGALTAPDGSMAMLNDAWVGPALVPTGEAVAELRDTGYVALRAGDDFAVLDVGALCPPHLPPHAHADALGFCLWADGEPLVADPGAYLYSGLQRDVFRSTRAHATVEVDDRDQCTFWGPFRAVGLPRVRLIDFERRDDVVIVVAEHDGYRRLPDPVVHRRRFCWLPGNGLVALDTLHARHAHRVCSVLPLAPGVSWEAGRIGPLILQALGSGPRPDEEAASYAPYLGVLEATTVVRRVWDVQPHQPFGWALLRDGAVTVDESWAQIEHPGGVIRLRL